MSEEKSKARLILERGAKLIETGWTTEAFARTAGDAVVSPLDPNAVCWCAGGAFDRAVEDVMPEGDYVGAGHTAYRTLREVLREKHPDTGLYDFNDSQLSPEPVIQLFTEAAARA